MNQHDSNAGMVRRLLPGHRINDARLGMAMKEVFRRWNQVGRDPFGDKRDGFVNEVLDAYFLFTEISERLQEIVKGCRGVCGGGWCGFQVRVLG